MTHPPTKVEEFFYKLMGFRWGFLLLGLIFIVTTASFLPTLSQDTTANSFIDPAEPSLITRTIIEDTFGLKDPIVIAVIDDRENGVFQADTLSLVQTLTDSIRKIEFIDPDKVTSLATENNIVGVADGIIAEGFFDSDTEWFEAPFGTSERAEEIKQSIADFPLYQGSLVARDNSATIILAELIDERQSTEAYEAIQAVVDAADAPASVVLHVAGEGAVSGYLSEYISRDARRLNPIAGVIITFILIIAFFSARGAIIPNLVIAATVLGSIGTMAAMGVSFYVITNGLIVNLIGIAVADSIHIMSAYYEELRDDPKGEARRLVARALAKMWRPVTLTTVTTIAGFAALAASSVMPPIFFFGIFGALGVIIAWVFSLLFLPSILTIWPAKRVPRPFRTMEADRENFAAATLEKVGRVILGSPRKVLAFGAVAAVMGVIGASQVYVDEARIENFKPTEPLYIADYAINDALDGTYYLDVLVDTGEANGLFDPAVLREIEALQSFLVAQPYVEGTTSVVDYVKQLHRAVNEGEASAYTLPDNEMLIGQLFFLYNASADPTDFEEEVDTQYSQALIRANVTAGRYSINRELVPAVETYLAERFTDNVTAQATGRVTVDYYWIKGIGDTNSTSVLLAFGAVLLVAVLLFRSIIGGLIATIPVAAAVLVVYAVMGYTNIPLGVGTSMFSAIAIGLSIDFAIHALDRIRELVREEGFTDEALLKLYPSTGRALFFNFVALALGFGVLLTSDVPPLVKFGGLVALAVSVAFIASLTLLPALVKVLKPRFLVGKGTSSNSLSTLTQTKGVVS